MDDNLENLLRALEGGSDSIETGINSVAAIAGALPLITMVIRFILPLLAAVILFRCLKSLLRVPYEPEIWGYLSLPNGSRVALYHWENVIGRARSSDVVLNYPTLSRSHLALIRDDKARWTAIDLGSKGGVTVNGKAIEDSARVYQGDVLGMGGVEVALLELPPEEIHQQRKTRTRPGRWIKPSFTFLLITVFQVLLLLQHCIAMISDFNIQVPLGFLGLIAIMWGYFFFIRIMRRTGFEIEALAFFLCSVGMSVVASKYPDECIKTAILILAGLLFFIIICWILRDLNRAKRMRWAISLMGIGFLGVGLIVSRALYGAYNWISIGGITLQPSEFVKVAFIFAGTATLDRLFARRNLIMFIGYSIVCVGILALMNDFGMAAVYFASFLMIAFLRSGDLATIALSLGAVAMGIILVLAIKPHVADRFATWGHVWEDPYGNGMQQALTMSSVASGGLFGLGAGNGVLSNVVAADTDLVFGVICEELGLLVAVICVAGVVVMGVFAIRTSSNARSSFYVIASGAAMTMFMAQLILNVFGSLDIIPFTGMTFPFVSKGGSSMMSCWGLLAFVKAADNRQNASIAIKLNRKTMGDHDPDELFDEEEEYEEEYEAGEEYEDLEMGEPYEDGIDPRYFDEYGNEDSDLEGVVDQRYFDERYDWEDD